MIRKNLFNRSNLSFLHTHRQDGSMTFTLAISTIGGILFFGLFFNLFNYLIARNAIESAARETIRCITPTDGECSVDLNPVGVREKYQWYGYRQGPPRDPLHFLERADYSASMIKSQWGIQNYQTQEVHRAKPTVSWTTYKIPQRRYKARLNEWFTVSGQQETVFEKRWVRGPNFPKFDLKEQENNNNLGPDTWKREFDAKYAVDFKRANDVEAKVKKGVISEISFGRIAVAKLPSNVDSPGLACIKQDGRSCDVATLAGATGIVTPDWHDTAYLALKVFTKVKAPGQSKSTSHFGITGVPKVPGFSIKIWDASGKFLEDTCLGGRSTSDKPLGPGGSWYNLWLRGPSGSNGGDNANCPNDDKDHAHIAVPRGGSFEVILKLKASDADMDTVSSLLYYTDEDYKLESEQQVKFCPSFVQKNGEWVKPKATECGLSNEFSVVSLLGVKDAVATPYCDPVVNAKLNLVHRDNLSAVAEVKDNIQEFAPNTYDVFACQNNWVPPRPEVREIPQGRKFCGRWEVEELSDQIEVASVSPICELAIAENHHTICKDSLYGEENINNCTDAINDLQRIAKSVKNMPLQPSLPGLPTFNPDLNFTWTGYTEDYWREQWLALDSNNKVIPPDGVRIKIKHNQLQSGETIQRYKHSTGPVWGEQPLTKEAALKLLPDSPPHEEVYGWGIYSENADNYLRLTESVLIEEKMDTGKYPFSGHDPRIYFSDGTPQGESGYDFDLDCKVEASCQNKSKLFSSLEQALRSYAGEKYPEANNLEYAFNYTESNVSMHFVEKQESIQLQKQYPDQCLPFKSTCLGLDSTYGIEAKQIATLEAGQTPEECKNGTYRNCYSKPVINRQANSLVPILFDQDKAHQKALTEIRSLIPYAKDDSTCKNSTDPACAVIKTQLQPDQAHVQVAINYNMPLVFPADLIFAKDHIHLQYSTEGILEIALLR